VFGKLHSGYRAAARIRQKSTVCSLKVQLVRTMETVNTSFAQSVSSVTQKPKGLEVCHN